MTAQATTIQPSKRTAPGLIGTTALTFTVLAGVAIWQVRSEGKAAAPATSATTRTINEGVAPRGGMAELLADQQAATAFRGAPATTKGGMAEMYADQRAAAARETAAPVTVPTAQQRAEWDQEQRYAETVAALLSARTASELDGRIGGMAELWRDRACLSAAQDLPALTAARQSDTMGGMAELYRERALQTLVHDAGSDSVVCGVKFAQEAC